MSTTDMNTTRAPFDTSIPLDPRLKISALWISTLFVFAYVDIFSLYRPGILDDIQGGRIHTFDITETFLFLTTLYVVVPSLMVFLTIVMRPRLNRNTNLAVAGFYALTVIGGAVGEWSYYVFGSAVEVVLLLAVIYYARTLVCASTPSNPTPNTAPTRRTSSTATIVLAIAALAVAGAAAAGGLSMSRTEEIAEAVFDPAQITDVPSIIAKYESGGFKLLGIELDAPDRRFSVAVKPPADCLRTEGGEEVVIGGDGCDAVELFVGPVQGGGITAQGERWVELLVEVDRECHRAAAVGDPWPALPESCR